MLVVSWANGLLPLAARRRAPRPARASAAGCSTCAGWCRCPSPTSCAHARAVGRVVVVDETRHTGGVGEAVVTALVEAGFTGPIRRVAAADSFVPLGDAATLVLVSENDIADAVRDILR